MPAGPPFLAALPEVRRRFEEPKQDGSWPAGDFGDRETEAVFIGIGLDKASILAALEAALLSDAEFEAGEAAWKEIEDVFFGGEFFELKQAEGWTDGSGDGADGGQGHGDGQKKRVASVAEAQHDCERHGVDEPPRKVAKSTSTLTAEAEHTEES